VAGYLGQRALLGLIRGYRRHLSGRGPLRRVTCTFSATESCSAHGQRVAAEVARSLPGALRLIRARLRRCREASLYRAGPGLAWGELYDDLSPAFADQVAALPERPATRRLLLLSAAQVARYSGRPELALCLLGQARPLPGRPALVLRDGARVPAWLLRRLCRRGLAVLVLLLLALLVPGPLCWGLAAAWALLGWRAQWRRARRLYGLLMAARFRAGPR
jgi:putative component of membrane protein insertase Oxa1/YidC/SpoIIIJ protein YidD